MDLGQILPSFGSGLFTLLAFVIALSVVVAIHEYGHYIVGRWTGIHAEVFSLGMGPVLFTRTDKRGTRWQLAALPLGGYVKFLGDANAASVGTGTQVSEADRRRTMAGAPLWARVLTVLAGPVFNFVLAAIIFAALAMTSGRAVDPLTLETQQDLPAPFVSELQTGDEIMAIAGLPVDFANGLIDALPRNPVLPYLIMRDGKEMTVNGPYVMPPLVSGINPRSAADDAGLRIGDVVTAVDGAPVVAFAELVDVVKAAQGTPLVLDVWRAGETRQVTLSPRRVDLPKAEGGFETRWLIGITGKLFFDERVDRLGLVESLQSGLRQLQFVLTSSLSGLWHMITGAISSCNLSGPVGIAQTSGSMASQGGTSFIAFIGMLSAAVGLLNLFPIPILDGGHLVFHAYEAITRRKPSDKAFNILMFAGLGLILSFMCFALLNDLVLCP